MTRIGMALGAAALTVGLGAGVFAAPFDGAQGRPGGRGGFGGPGGPGGPGGRMGRGGPLGGMVGPMGPGLPLQELNLTSAQKEQVQSIMKSHEGEMRAIGERGRAAHEALEAASTNGTFDEGLIRTKAADVAAVESDMAVMHARIYSEIFQILTEEQKAKLQELQTRRAERRDRFEQRRPQ